MKFLNKKGVTLLEVMVVVGLIAILTAIAVPNYMSYQRQARTAEAQSSLSQIYMAEKSFFLQWRFYTTDLVTIGVFPDGKLLYNTGFGATYPSAAPSGYRGTTLVPGNKDFKTICGTEFGGTNAVIKSCAFRPPKSNCQSFSPPAIDSSATASDTEFTAIAIGNLLNICNTNANGGYDVWEIDQYKQLNRCNDGTRSINNPVTACP